MKKFVITILALFYLGVSSGATVDIHYCMGQLIDWSISQGETEECANCGMEKGISEDCCKDQQHKLSVKESPLISKVVYHFNTLGVKIPSTNYKKLAEGFEISTEENKVVSNSPPRTQATAAFIRNCSLRI